MNDLRFAFRQLLKAPGFAIVAVLTLAVGIGASTAMFSALRALVVEPFSYPDSGRLVHVWSSEGQPLSIPDYFDLSDRVTSFTDFGAYTPESANLGGEKARMVLSISTTSGVLRAMGIQPQLGRLIQPQDEVRGAAPVAVISHRLWQETFGGDPALVGRRVRMNAGEVTVVGIMPASFEFAGPWIQTSTCDVWTPMQLKRGEGDRGSHWLCAVGRLKPGVPLATANAEIKAIGAQLKAAYPNTNAKKPFFVRSLRDEMTRNVSSQVWMLFGAVSLVLLIACANVASMLLARSARRQAEFGVRIALGANRRQVLRLALAESIVLAAGGAIVGVVLAWFGAKALAAIAPVSEARRAAISLDLTVLAFTIGVSAVTALLAGIPPALAALRISVSDLLRTEGRGATSSRSRHNTLRALIVAQVAVAFVLANGAALFSSSYLKLLAANQALATDRVLSAQATLMGERYRDTKQRAVAWDRITERVAALPGVSAVGITAKLPLEGGSNMTILVNDETFDPNADRVLAEISAITPGYFAAIGLPLLRGRTLNPGDAGEKNIGVVVNRALADKCWPGKDPLGQIIRPSTPEAWFLARVVGVVEDVRQWGPENPPRPEVYWPADRAWGQNAFLIVRSPLPASQLTPLLRREVAAFDPDLPLARVRTMQGVVDDATEGNRAIVELVNFFMAVALGLVAVGLYGTLTYHVLQRTREIGIRMAMGAGRRDVVRLVFGQGSRWVTLGLALGTAGAIGLTFALKSMVYGLEGIDPVSLVLAVGAVCIAAFIACWLPARRASRVDPITALRSD